MNRHITFRTIGIILILFALCFVGYALTHPEASFPWNIDITYGIYLAYAIVTIAVFLLGFVYKKREKK